MRGPNPDSSPDGGGIIEKRIHEGVVITPERNFRHGAVDPETDRIVRVRLDARENPPARRRRIFPIIAECRNPEHGAYLS